MTTSPSPGPSRPWGTLGAGAAAVAACAVCCAGPVLAVLGSIGAASAIAAVWVPALAVLAVAARLGGFAIRRRRRHTACHSSPALAVDLGVPAPVAAKVPVPGPEQ
ncbi:hypothetical protein [Streptomyces sp. NPDC050564]|uniref:hypothetical protein n=1 Tax=Streptomyces sp. NPDC050564 TaxID=3365631 RepID=UPI0037B39A16